MIGRLTVTLPIPPSVNRLYRAVHGRVLISADGRAYHAEAEMLIRVAAMHAGWRTQPRQRYGIRLVFHFGSERRRDLDNCVKIMQDSAAAALGFDDARVDHLVALRGTVDRDNPRALLTVTVLEDVRMDVAV